MKTEREIIEKAIELIHIQGWTAAPDDSGPTCLEFALCEAITGKRGYLDLSPGGSRWSLFSRRRKMQLSVRASVLRHTGGIAPWYWNDCATEGQALTLLKDIYAELPL